jgi:hypothetical protein
LVTEFVESLCFSSHLTADRFYTVDSILDYTLLALNDPPRKLNYNAVVSFLQYNRPPGFDDAEEFLYHAFDEEGRFTRGAAAWLLLRVGVFKAADGEQPDIKTLFPPLSELEVSRSRDAVLMRSAGAEEPAAEPLTQSMGQDELDDLVTSTDFAVQHVCDNCAHHKNFY